MFCSAHITLQSHCYLKKHLSVYALKPIKSQCEPYCFLFVCYAFLPRYSVITSLEFYIYIFLFNYSHVIKILSCTHRLNIFSMIIASDVSSKFFLQAKEFNGTQEQFDTICTSEKRESILVAALWLSALWFIRQQVPVLLC